MGALKFTVALLPLFFALSAVADDQQLNKVFDLACRVDKKDLPFDRIWLPISKAATGSCNQKQNPEFGKFIAACGEYPFARVVRPLVNQPGCLNFDSKTRYEFSQKIAQCAF